MIRCLLVLLACLNVALSNPNCFKVEGDSMLPNIKSGSRVYTDNSVKLNELRSGDIVVFQAEGNFVVHRFYRKYSAFYTKGDNNPLKDRNYINEKTLVGKVVKIY